MCVVTMLFILSCKSQIMDFNYVPNRIAVNASNFNVDPDLAIAIGIVESGLNWAVIGSHGELGPLQVKRYGKGSIYTVEENIKAGIKYMAEAKARCSHYPGFAWVNCYNMGIYAKRLRHPKKFVYYKRVSEEFLRIKFNKFLAKGESGYEKFNRFYR